MEPLRGRGRREGLGGNGRNWRQAGQVEFEQGGGCGGHGGGNGVCMMNSFWRDEQHPSFIHFISSFLGANSYRMNFLPISPDFIFNNGGLSVAFVFVTNWDRDNKANIFPRIDKLKKQFQHFYVVVLLPSKEQNDSFNDLYFRYSTEIGNPTFVQVRDLEMGFEKIVKIAHAHGVCKKGDCVTKMKNERERAVQAMDKVLRVVTSIPGIDIHDAHTLIQAIGSIEAIARTTKVVIVENTDLSADKAQGIVDFFRDPQFYLSPKIIQSSKFGRRILRKENIKSLKSNIGGREGSHPL